MMIYNSDNNQLYQYNINGEWIKMTEFKVGHKVKITGAHDFEGAEGVIHKIDDKHGYAEVQVDLFDEESGVIAKISNLTLIEEAKDDSNCGCPDTKKSAWEKETKQALYDKIKPAVEEWAKEQNEKTVAKRKFKNGDILAMCYGSHTNQNLRFVEYKDDGRVFAKGLSKLWIGVQGISEFIATEDQFCLQHEYEAQQKPKVGDKVWVKGTIVKIDESTVPYKVDFSSIDIFVGANDTMMLWIRNVKKCSDLED